MSNDLNKKFNLPVDGSGFDRKVPMKPDDSASSDHNYVRENIYSNIELATEALQDLFELARSSQLPRSYEAFAVLFKEVQQANKDFIELHQKRKDLEKVDPEVPTTVNNNLYVTTETLAKMIEDASKKST